MKLVAPIDQQDKMEWFYATICKNSKNATMTELNWTSLFVRATSGLLFDVVKRFYIKSSYDGIRKSDYVILCCPVSRAENNI